ncbi:hypothetical protein MIR68_002386 [Amoeboaphelidium protococcarum]|nr:hypothetical protein MIR68_002386 [Amoeboaphelidium protococcarum]
MFTTPSFERQSNRSDQDTQNQVPASPFVKSFFIPNSTSKSKSAQDVGGQDKSKIQSPFAVQSINSSQQNLQEQRQVKSFYDTLESTPRSSKSIDGSPMSLGTPIHQYSAQKSLDRTPLRYNIPASVGLHSDGQQTFNSMDMDNVHKKRITTFGFPIEKAEKVLRKLSANVRTSSSSMGQSSPYNKQSPGGGGLGQNGTIVDYVVKDRWMHIEFQSEFYAQIALTKNGELMVDGYIVGICPYRESIDDQNYSVPGTPSDHTMRFSDAITGSDRKSPMKSNRFKSQSYSSPNGPRKYQNADQFLETPKFKDSNHWQLQQQSFDMNTDGGFGGGVADVSMDQSSIEPFQKAQSQQLHQQGPLVAKMQQTQSSSVGWSTLGNDENSKIRNTIYTLPPQRHLNNIQPQQSTISKIIETVLGW